LSNTKLNYTNIIFLNGIPLISIAGLIYWLKSGSYNLNTIILTAVMFTFVQLSITAGYHRLFSHRAYEAHPLIKIFFLLFGAAGLQGTALKWSQDHRRHHRFIDDIDKDPYSINKGFWWAHIGWLFYEGKRTYNPEEVADLYKDKYVLFQFKYYLRIGFGVGFILPMLVACIWHDPFGGLLLAGALRLTLNYHSTFFINSLAHTLGKQNFSDAHSSRDNLITAILTFGEGYHNFHHEFPSDYRNGIHFYDFDPTKWLIYGLSRIGLTTDLKQSDRDLIIKKQAIMMTKNFRNIFKTANSAREHFMIRIVTKLSGNVENQFSKLNKLKKEKVVSLSSNEQSMISKEIKKAQREFKLTYKLLGKIISRFEQQFAR
jgi:stearoyl-CoA desaturase (delta-9 desaturase)